MWTKDFTLRERCENCRLFRSYKSKELIKTHDSIDVYFCRMKYHSNGDRENPAQIFVICGDVNPNPIIYPFMEVMGDGDGRLNIPWRRFYKTILNEIEYTGIE